VAREGGVIAGLEEACELFSAFGVAFSALVEDGARVVPGAVLAELEGPAQPILLVERTALNIMGRMSGIATMTRDLQGMLDRELPGARVASTRKTCPGLRLLDKKAVFLGGGDPHRLTLSDGILIKDNHLALVPLETAIARAKAHSCYRKVEVEVETPEMAVRAVRAGADMLLLDNMDPGLVRETLRLLGDAGLPQLPLVESPGGLPQRTSASSQSGASLSSASGRSPTASGTWTSAWTSPHQCGPDPVARKSVPGLCREPQFPLFRWRGPRVHTRFTAGGPSPQRLYGPVPNPCPGNEWDV